MPSSKDTATALHHAVTSRLKVRQLTLLQSIHRHRSLNRVAAEIGLSQPAITKALREVEDIFSFQLFERSNRGLLPTAMGEAVLAHAERWMAELESSTRALAAVHAGLRGRMRLGFTHYVPQALLSAAVEHCLGREPQIAMLAREGTTDELVAAIVARELDCAIGRSFDGESSEIVQHAIYQQEPCLLVSAKSFKRLSRGGLDWALLAQLNWILPPPNTPMRRTFNTIFVGAGVQPPAPLLETLSLRSIETVLRMDANAVTILPTDVASDFVNGGFGAVLPYKLAWNLPPVSFFTLKQPVTEPAVTALHGALLQTVALMRARNPTAGSGPSRR